MKNRAILALEDGSTYKGRVIGDGSKTVTGELVFNTSMTGYQEILTDPSYAGQVITFTFPTIGIYGENDVDNQSRRIFARGLVISDLATHYENSRALRALAVRLEKEGIIGIEGIDTRMLTRKLRNHGVMRCCVSSELTAEDAVSVSRNAPDISSEDLVGEVTTSSPYQVARNLDLGYGVLLFDYGVKKGILENLMARGCFVRVVPATAGWEAVEEAAPNGVVLSNGPGDPKSLGYTKEVIKRIVSSGIPLFGICLGHQLLALALGGDTYKLKFGHRGANHPVKDLKTGKVYITSHNHGFAVSPDRLEEIGIETTHLNVNDGTVEGLRVLDSPAFSVQYHPEGCPGPKDSLYLFDEFVRMMDNSKGRSGDGI